MMNTHTNIRHLSINQININNEENENDNNDSDDIKNEYGFELKSDSLLSIFC
jgi:thymidylate synthase